MQIRSEEEFKKARKAVVDALLNQKLGKEQRIILCGLSCALQWACNDGGSGLQDLIDGKPIKYSLG